VAELEETNARMKSGLEHSSGAVSELQSLYDKLNTLCEVLRMRGTMLDPVLKLWRQKLLLKSGGVRLGLKFLSSV
jgi:hypothetical protein